MSTATTFRIRPDLPHADRQAADKPKIDPYAKADYRLLFDGRLSMEARTVALALLFWACDRAECNPSNDRIAGRLGVNVAAVRRALKELKAIGYVEHLKVKPTSANMTGRVLVLRWRIEPESVMPPLPTRGIEASRPPGEDEGEGEGCAPVRSPLAHRRAAPLRAGAQPPCAPARSKEDRSRKKPSRNPPKKPDGEELHSCSYDNDNDPEAIHASTDRGDASAEPPGEPLRVEAAPDPAHPATLAATAPPGPSAPTPPEANPASAEGLTLLTGGQRAFLARLEADGLAATFDGLDEGKRKLLLDLHAAGFDAAGYGIAAAELRSVRKVAPPPSFDAPAEEVIRQLPRRSDLVPQAANALMAELGDGQQSWPYINILCHEVASGNRPPEGLLAPYLGVVGQMDKASRGEREVPKKGWPAYFVGSVKIWDEAHRPQSAAM